jgi:hypothetical protein
LKVLLRALSVLFAVAVALGCDATPAEREITAQSQSATSFTTTAFALQSRDLCPLGEAEVWLRPLSRIQVELVSGEKALRGEKREYQAKATYWCRGKPRNGHRSPLQGTAVARAVADVGTSYAGHSPWRNQEVGDASLLLGLVLFFGPTLVIGVVSLYIAAWSDWWIWFATDLWWLAILRCVLFVPALALPTLFLSGVGGTAWWAYQVFHSPWAVLLSPILSLPLVGLLSRIYLGQIASR